MLIRISGVQNTLFYTIIFLMFFGFYIALLILSNIGMQEISREVSIPIRIIIGGALLALFILNRKQYSQNNILLFSFFAVLFYSRILLDFLQINDYIFSTSELIFYFSSFAVLPFLALTSVRLTKHHLVIGRKAVTLSAFIFSFLALISYRKYIGVYSRLSGNRVDEDILGPLILSYCSSLAIGISLIYLIQSRLSVKQRLYPLSIIGLAVIPFYLGASRGSLLALVVPFLFIIWTRKNFAFNVKVVGLLTVSIFLLVYLNNLLGSGLLGRFMTISSGIESGGYTSGSERLLIWEQAFKQFTDKPIVGGPFKVEGYNSYPHNLFIEVLQTTGILGFIPFFFLVARAIYGSLRIFKYIPEHSWISVIFIQAFIQNMFSGAVFTASWFWASMALVFSVQYYINIKRKKSYGNFAMA